MIKERLQASGILKITFVVIVILACLTPMMIVSEQEHADPFLYRNLAFLEASQNESHPHPITPDQPGWAFLHRADHQAVHMTLMSINKVTDVPYKTLQSVPFVGIIIVIAAYILARKLSNSKVLAALLAIFMAAQVSLCAWSGPYVFGIALSLFFVFTFLYLRVLEEKRIGSLVCLFLVFVATHFYYYSIEVWMITFAVCVNLMLLLKVVLTKDDRARGQLTISAAMAFIVTFLGFNKTFYDKWLGEGRLKAIIGAPDLYLARFEHYLPGRQPEIPEPYQFTGPPNQMEIITQVDLAAYLIILLPIAIALIFFIKKIIAKRPGELGDRDIRNKFLYVGISSLVIGATQTAIYLPMGAVEYRYILLLFPFVTIISLNLLRIKSWLKVTTFVVLAILALTKFGLCLSAGADFIPPTRYADALPGSSWYFENTAPILWMLTDFKTAGRYMVDGAYHGLSFRQIYYNSDRYGWLVEDKYSSLRSVSLKSECDYIIVNKQSADARVFSMGWKNYEPLSEYLDNINENINIHKIYGDNVVWIFKTRPY